MADETKYARTTISVPPELKRRMEEVQESVNWSAVACRAFEDKLAELIAKQEVRDMNDVIARLRASKRRSDDAQYQAGAQAGRTWAEQQAEAEELQRLEDWKARCSWEWDRLFERGVSTAYSPGELMVFEIQPESDENRSVAEEFWEMELGDDTSLAHDPMFVKGFVEGALALWEQVKDRL